MFGVQKEVKVRDFVGNKVKFFGISGAMIILCIAALIFNKATDGNFSIFREARFFRAEN